MMFQKILIFGLALVLAACGIQPAPRPTATPFTGAVRPVIIDTDMDANDWMAILYLLTRLDVSVAAITVTGTGEAHCEPGIKEAGNQSGRTQADESGAPVRMAVDVQVERFEQLFLDTLNAPEK
jgi:inosine-uridine nucleoside N-ribohydrolase